MGEWRRCKIGDLCDEGLAELQTGPFGSQLHAYDYVAEGVPVVPTEAVRDRKIDHAVLPRIQPEKADELKRHRLLKGDILFARRGVQATGHTGYVKDKEVGFICGTEVIRFRVSKDNCDISREFLSHVFANPSSVEWFKFHAIGATMPNLNEGIIKGFPLLIPPLHDQIRISDVLTALNDKIELNRRMNETLEATARAIFKDWFVDFGPTRAKAEGREPYLAPEVWELFSDEFDDEGKPAGWSLANLSEIASLNPESWSRNNTPEAVEYVDLANTKWGAIEGTQRFLWQKAPSRAKRILRSGDTIVGTVRPGNGSFAFVGADGLTASTGFAVLRPKHFRYKELLYLAATSSENIARLAYLADGAAYPAVRPDVVAATELVLSDIAVLDRFAVNISPMMNHIEANKRESRTLAETCDLLLPKLMSGEIRLHKADKRLESVA